MTERRRSVEHQCSLEPLPSEAFVVTCRTMLHGACMTAPSSLLGGVDVFMWRRVAVRACRASCGNVAVSLTVGTAGESGCPPPFRLRKLEVHPELDLWSVDLICRDVRSDRSRSLSTVFELRQKTCDGPGWKVSRKVQDVKASFGCARASRCRRSTDHSPPSSTGVRILGYLERSPR